MSDQGYSPPLASYPTSVADDYGLGVQTNNYLKTLAASITSSGLAITVLESINDIPPTGVLTIRNERIRYSSVDVSTKTITIAGTSDRGFDGSTAASHTVGDAIRFNIVAHGHNQLSKEVQAIQTEVGPTGHQNFQRLDGTNSGIFSVLAFDGVGDGVTDDTDAIDAAAAAAKDAGGKLFLPNGTWVYNGDGIDWSAPDIEGLGTGKSIVSLGAGKYFLKITTAITKLQVKGIQFSGGAGAILSSYTSSNVNDSYIVDSCYFKNYTKAAISDNSSDMPYWKISRCIFEGNDYVSTMGVALGGLTDQCSITDCAFLQNRVSVKITNGANNVQINNCDFIRFGTSGSSPRIDIWVVPQTTSTNAGTGFRVTGCKFGNENLLSTDYRILYADEGSGADNGSKFPSLSADSVGYVIGHSIDDCHFSGGGSSIQAIVYSTTPNLRGCRYGPLVFSGTQPTYWVEFRTLPTADRSNSDNIIGPINGIDLATEDVSFPLASNATGVFDVIDPNELFSTDPTINMVGVSEPVDYIKLLPVSINSFNTSAEGTLVSATDGFGGSDAATVTLLAGNTGIYYPLTGSDITVGDPVWVEFDLKSGGGGPLTHVQAQLRYTSNGAIHWRRIVEVPTGWKRFRFLVYIREKTSAINMHFINTAVDGTVLVGRPKVYHAREPINVEGRFPTLSVGGDVTPWADDSYDIGTSELRWRDIYVSPGSVKVIKTQGDAQPTASLGDAKLSFGQGGVAQVDCSIVRLDVGSVAVQDGAGGYSNVNFTSPKYTVLNAGAGLSPYFTSNAATQVMSIQGTLVPGLDAVFEIGQSASRFTNVKSNNFIAYANQNDTVPAAQLDNTAALSFGIGGSSALDTFAFRQAAGVIAFGATASTVDGTVYAKTIKVKNVGGGSDPTISSNFASQAASFATQIYPAADNTYEVGAASYRYVNVTSNNFMVYNAAADTNPVSKLSSAGLLLGIGGGTAVDTSIVRAAAKSVAIQDAGGSGAGSNLTVAKVTILNAGGGSNPTISSNFASQASSFATQIYPAADNTYEVGGSGLRYANMASNNFLVYGTVSDANATAKLTSGALLFGAGGGTPLDTIMQRQSIGVWSSTSPINSGSVRIGIPSSGDPSIEMRAIDSDAQPGARYFIDGIRFGPGGASAYDTAFKRFDVSIMELTSPIYTGSVRYGMSGAATPFLALRAAAADSQPLATILTDRLAFGPGGSTTVDTSWIRQAAGEFASVTTRTITGTVADGVTAAIQLAPTYDAATAQTVTRHNYIELNNPLLTGAGPAAVTDAAVFRFDAAAGTHKAVDSGTTKTTPGGVDAWCKININGTLYYLPAFLSKTA